jgi:hypothetical protein
MQPADSDCVLPNNAPVAPVSTGNAYRCLPEPATAALGWV